MKFGVTIFATDQTTDVVELAREIEARGFDSLYLPEHTHIPTSRLTPSPTGEDDLPEMYKRSLDPLVALAGIATATSRIRIGTGVMLPAQREPLVTAKAIATLQNLSNGRFVLGVGFGWNKDEIEHHGIEFGQRREVAREHLGAMAALWNHDVAEYHGDFVDFEPSWSWPKPEQAVPILMGGGSGPKLVSHLVEYCDGWIPIGGSGLAQDIPRIRQALEDAGRDPQGFEIVPFGSLPTLQKLEHFEQIGVTECVFRLPSAGYDEVMAALDEQSHLIDT